VLSPSSSANYKALLIYIIYILYLNIILSNLSLQQVKVELVLNKGISIVIISIYSCRVLRDKIDSVPVNKAYNLALRD
jgi:hypothetical protein